MMSHLQSKEHAVLRKHYVALVQCLDAVSLLDGLFQNGVIEMDDYQRVRNGQTKTEKTRNLLQLIWARMGDRTQVFYDFINALKQDEFHDFLEIIKDAENLLVASETAVKQIFPAAASEDRVPENETDDARTRPSPGENSKSEVSEVSDSGVKDNADEMNQDGDTLPETLIPEFDTDREINRDAVKGVETKPVAIKDNEKSPVVDDLPAQHEGNAPDRSITPQNDGPVVPVIREGRLVQTDNRRRPVRQIFLHLGLGLCLCLIVHVYVEPFNIMQNLSPHKRDIADKVPKSAPPPPVIDDKPKFPKSDFVSTLYGAVREMTAQSGTITHQGRELRYQVKGNFYRWKWVWQGTVTDVVTGITGRSHNKKGRDGALQHATSDLMNQLRNI